jgi:hypothetical protein
MRQTKPIVFYRGGGRGWGSTTHLEHWIDRLDNISDELHAIAKDVYQQKDTNLACEIGEQIDTLRRQLKLRRVRL